MIALEVPYTYANNAALMGRIVLNDERPQIPNEWPYKLRDLLRRCWDVHSYKRPDFNNIYDTVVKLMES